MPTGDRVAAEIVDAFRDVVPDEKMLGIIHDIAHKRLRRVSDMAEHTGIQLRTLRREFDRYALPQPSQWVQLVNMLCAMLPLIDQEKTTIREASKAAGYPDQFTFSNQMHRIVGIRPAAALEQGLTSRDLIQRWMDVQAGKDVARAS